MKTPSLMRLYPPPHRELPLQGQYLGQQLHRLGTSSAPFVYANFVTSLDGRIALRNTQGGPSYMPSGLTSPNDFRLFLELHAQADCLITHGGYLRALAQNRLGNILQLDSSPQMRDLCDWRLSQGLERQPAVLVVSSTLDFEIPDSIRAHRQPLYIATGQSADPQRVQYWRRKGYEVILAGSSRQVEGGPLIDAVANLGFRSLYLIAGPRLLDTMLRDRRLSRLYLTLTHQLLGGEAFHSLIPGASLGMEGAMRLRELYYDLPVQGVGQWFTQFEPAGSSDDVFT
jgi:riboflavin biosynthesis pyrimidine reductase